MAKAKAKKVVTSTGVAIEDELLSRFGANIIFSGEDIVNSQKKVIPISPVLDRILGGGVPEGSFVILTGPPKVGKTVSANMLAANAQKPIYDATGGPRKVYFYNIEGRLKSRDLLGIHGLDPSPERFKIIGSEPGKILHGEDYLDIAENLINAVPGSIHIIDSFSALCTSGERESNIGDRYRADAPVMLAKFCRRIANVIPINNNIVIGITHLIANQGMGMSQWSEASGRKIQYQADVKLKCTFSNAWTEGDTQVGQNVNWICETSAIGPPGGKCESKLRYGYGLDKEVEILDMSADLGLITKGGGGWYTFAGDHKVQGAEKASQYLKENPELYDELNSSLRDMMDYPKAV